MSLSRAASQSAALAENMRRVTHSLVGVATKTAEVVSAASKWQIERGGVGGGQQDNGMSRRQRGFA